MAELPPSPSQTTSSANVVWQRNLSNFNHPRLSEPRTLPQPSSRRVYSWHPQTTAAATRAPDKTTIWFDNFGSTFDDEPSHSLLESKRLEDPFGDIIDDSIWPSDDCSKQIAEEKVISHIEEIEEDYEQPSTPKSTNSASSSSGDNVIKHSSKLSYSRSNNQRPRSITDGPATYFPSRRFSRWTEKRGSASKQPSNSTKSSSTSSSSSSSSASTSPYSTRMASWTCFMPRQ